LWLGHQSMSIYSWMGIILLMGIVKKNSIMLVDFTNQMREQGMDVHDALRKACPIRLRPILMTSLATIAAAIRRPWPLVRAPRSGSRWRSPSSAGS